MSHVLLLLTLLLQVQSIFYSVIYFKIIFISETQLNSLLRSLFNVLSYTVLTVA